MYKMTFGAKRKPGMSREDFGIKRYVVNLAATFGDRGVELAYDGFAEAWFDDVESMRLSNRSPELKVVLEDEKNLFDLSTRWSVVVQEHVMIGDG